MVESLNEKKKVVGFLRGIPIYEGQMVILKIRGKNIAFVAGRDLIYEDGSWKYNNFGQMVGM